jgi:hypothetical protein
MCEEAAEAMRVALHEAEWPAERLQAAERAFFAGWSAHVAAAEAAGDAGALAEAAVGLAEMADDGAQLPDDLRAFLARRHPAA